MGSSTKHVLKEDMYKWSIKKRNNRNFLDPNRDLLRSSSDISKVPNQLTKTNFLVMSSCWTPALMNNLMQSIPSTFNGPSIGHEFIFCFIFDVYTSFELKGDFSIVERSD